MSASGTGSRLDSAVKNRCALDRPCVQERRGVWVKEICDSFDVWSDTFQQFKPLTGYRGLEIRETIRRDRDAQIGHGLFEE